MGNVTWHKIDYTINYDECVEFKRNGIGSSSVAAVLGHDEYKCNLELFYEKISGVADDVEALAALLGVDTEPIIDKWWKHWDGTKNERNLWYNLKNNIIVRETEDIKSVCVDDDMPYLHASMDRRILQYGTFNTPGALECKHTQRFILDKYENRIVTGHLLQNLTQIFVPKYEFGEVAYLFENKKFECHQLHDITPYSELIENIKSEIKHFWDCVVAGRKLYTEKIDAEINFKFKLAADIDAEIARIEPPVQNTDCYLKFLTEKFKNRKAGIGIIKGTEEHYKSAKTHKDLKAQIDNLQSKLVTEEINLKTALGDKERMEFEKHIGSGYITWAKSSNGIRPFLNKVK